MVTVKELKDIAALLRRDVLQMTTQAQSGHATSCLSCAEIISVLYFNEMSYDKDDENNPDNDEFVLSKGHAAPIYYAALKRAGCVNDDIMALRKFDSPFEGHPIPSSMPWAKVATGSLGQGLSVGIGIALALQKQKRTSRVYVLLGDSECAEGSVWEALQLAAYYKLNNICAIVDVNKLGQRGETMYGHNIEVYKKKFESFGFQTFSVNGHDLNSLLLAFKKARASKKPSVILAKTTKGKGVSLLESKEGWHGRALSKEELQQALAEIPNPEMPIFTPNKPISKGKIVPNPLNKVQPLYMLSDEMSTREAYGNALAQLVQQDPSVIALDAEVSNSTFAEKAKRANPNQFVECFIAEQNMIGLALGLSIKDFTPFASTFAAFLTRAHDQLRMAALSSPNLTICGSHAGVSIGEDGASQMGLEDLSLFRSLPDSIVLYPSDAVSTEKILAICANTKGLKYVRTTRPKTTVIYPKEEEFALNSFKVIRSSKNDKVVLVGAGITLHEALRAYGILEQKKISASVLDMYCIKPFPRERFIAFVRQHGSRVVVAEDHYTQGGLGEALVAACVNLPIRIKHLSISEIPHSGTKEELLAYHGIDAEAIARAAREIL